MRWQDGTRSEHVEDRRFRGPTRKRGVQLGIGGLVVVLVGIFLGPEAAQLASQFATSTSTSSSATHAEQSVERRRAETPQEKKQVAFMHWLHDNLRTTWTKVLGARYQHPRLVLFSEATNTGCGYSTKAIGPFYCPPDQAAYIDLTFFRELSDKLKAPGDFAQAYVLAHEIGHHIQNLLGTSQKMRRQQRGKSKRRQNQLSVLLELQADCYAGVWGHYTEKKDLLDPGDIEEGLTAAAAIGDDRLQRRAGAPVNAETWTHGSSEQRVEWFMRGLKTGKVSACDTFGGSLR